MPHRTLRVQTVALVALLALTAPTVAAQGRPAPPEVVAWVRTHAVPLDGADPALPDADLDALAPLLGDAHVVGLGEGTHGTREFFQFRDRVLRWLARRGELGALFWEQDFVGAFAREARLNDPDVPIEQTMFGSGTWGTDENMAMLTALRQHNRSTDTPAHFIGVDAFDLPGSLGAAVPAAQRVGGDALRALAVLDSALATPVAQACGSPETCYGAFLRMDIPAARRFAEGAAWLADALDRAGPREWQAAVAARIAENRTRHILQFTLFVPTPLDGTDGLQRIEDQTDQAQARTLAAADTLARAVGAQDPDYWRTVAPVLEALPAGFDVYRDSLSAAQRYAWSEAVRGLRARVGTGRYGDDPTLTRSADALVAALDRLHQALRTPPTHMDFDNYREVAIGATLPAVVRALDRERGGQGRYVFAAHNAHVGYNPSATLARKPSGAFVRDALGDDYLAVGTFWGTGTFQASDRRAYADGWTGPEVRAFSAGPPAPASFEAALLEVSDGVHPFALDLRQLPAQGPVADWFRTPRPTHDVGNNYDPNRPEDYVEDAVVADGFDVVVFFPSTTRAVPIASAIARGGYDLSLE